VSEVLQLTIIFEPVTAKILFQVPEADDKSPGVEFL
jgi:hypothetical protein